MSVKALNGPIIPILGLTDLAQASSRPDALANLITDFYLAAA